jgi:membrane protease YdiL (CAAX protease family)
MKAILFDESGRLRSGWRAIAFLFVFFFAAFVLTGVEELIVRSLPADQETGETYYTVINLAGLVLLAIIVGAIAGRVFERKPFKTIGASLTKGWFWHLLVGLVLGSLALVIAVLIPLIAGRESFEIDQVSSDTLTNSLLTSFVVFALAAAWEEAFFRGYLLQTFVRSGMATWGVLGLSLFFGVVHLANPSATIISATNTVLAGIVFSLAYLKTRDLWFPWGLHLMWNWMQGSIFGIEVSGITSFTKAPLLREIDRGPEWLTGASYGIEGSISCTVALIILAVMIYFLPGIKPDPEVLALNQPGS